MGKTKRREVCLVIGGCSFIGRHLVEGLVADGFQVKLLDSQSVCEIENVTFIQGDFCNRDELESALQGIDVVFHCVSVCSSDGNMQMVDRINIHGTRQLVEACNDTEVKKLILVTSCAIISDLGKHTRNGRECQPYAKRPFDHSFHTKVLQEQIVLRANSQSLLTTSIRLFAVFGPQPAGAISPHNLFSINSYKYAIGSGYNLSDFTYVGNVVHGLILASDHLYPSSPVCGQAYNITNGEPVSFNWLLNSVMEGLECDFPRKRFPFWLMFSFAFLLNIIYSIFSVCKLDFRTNLTLPSVNVAGKDSYYCIDKARAQLGYKPVYSLQQGLDITIQCIRVGQIQ
ncbi:Sterol-4-alpha-carboxylate 3-dehydrogenase, decarboxylating-like [Oopsacas minuta]|uniref:Sterol-4-alpha-carboxylate 3-dehydrogenase, decarboxylating-like n=1 Tax=Oopsacas minuta TaxID=111878 RepID=A0AAV7JKM2_9METZ|nr:Sterol-4-alpha-carboxylate 3-dehydrogenase, decarboxylating-like [Oopsacas minuta]